MWLGPRSGFSQGGFPGGFAVILVSRDVGCSSTPLCIRGSGACCCSRACTCLTYNNNNNNIGRGVFSLGVLCPVRIKAITYQHNETNLEDHMSLRAPIVVSTLCVSCLKLGLALKPSWIARLAVISAPYSGEGE